MRLERERFLVLPYSDVLFFSDRIEAEEAEKAKSEMIVEAFGAWLQGAGGKKDFIPYLVSLGLEKKKEPLKAEEKAAMIEKSNSIADRILKMSMKRRPGKRSKNG